MNEGLHPVKSTTSKMVGRHFDETPGRGTHQSDSLSDLTIFEAVDSHVHQPRARDNELDRRGRSSVMKKLCKQKLCPSPNLVVESALGPHKQRARGSDLPRDGRGLRQAGWDRRRRRPGGPDRRQTRRTLDQGEGISGRLQECASRDSVEPPRFPSPFRGRPERPRGRTLWPGR